MNTQAFLKIDAITKEFGDFRAVNQVGLEVAKGEIFALLGSSGSGKSTLLRMLAGFERPSSGRVWLDGQDLTDVPPYERPVNMMFQSYALFPHLNVWDNIAFGLRREKLPREQVAERVEAMLRLVQLQELARRKPHQLSGGQQQRVALARSLAKRPQLLLLDEPLGALDKKLREQTQIELVNIIGQIGVTCVLVTHDQEEAMMMASRIAVMSQGALLQVGPPAQVYENPGSRFVADFVGNVNLMDGKLAEGSSGQWEVHCADMVHVLAQPPQAHAGEQVTVAVRPEKIDLDRLPLDPAQGNQTLGTVSAYSYFGDSTMFHLRLPSGSTMKVSVENDERQGCIDYAIGDQVRAVWPAGAQIVLTR
ncbi:ABC transporter ATP-binding protein [Corticibacter populi]|uniref:Spermidine/putrescine import ATP-binding protein PotA n=1 Tax=Corticibacter populi TaxID=1550736 RepID=A0A3M6QSI0_9BURK|nr:ABC transporter ATP-binding protein [Corticibacter populi]RMX05801.1 ABC transporter ATP-binding protein [Corticibacter populi]RZS30889.1 putrescine transport system ATP-binding protein [Corticibacter populi]